MFRCMCVNPVGMTMQSGCELQEAVVATIRRILLFLPAAMIALLAGCGGTASSGASSPIRHHDRFSSPRLPHR